MVNEPIWTRWHPQPHHTIPILLPKWSIKHSTLHNSLAWKYEKVMLLCNQDYKWSGTPGNNIGILWWGRGCERAQICSLTMLHVSDPYLASLSFYTIPIIPLLQVFLIYLYSAVEPHCDSWTVIMYAKICTFYVCLGMHRCMFSV